MNAFEGLLHGLECGDHADQPLCGSSSAASWARSSASCPVSGPPATISILLPLATGFNPATGLIAMAGIYYGAKYGGSTTSILLNIPGESSSVVTCIDGYEMAKKVVPVRRSASRPSGRSWRGTLGVIGLTFLAPVVRRRRGQLPGHRSTPR